MSAEPTLRAAMTAAACHKRAEQYHAAAGASAARGAHADAARLQEIADYSRARAEEMQGHAARAAALPTWRTR